MRRRFLFFWLFTGFIIITTVLPITLHTPPSNESNLTTTITTTTSTTTTITVPPTTTSTTTVPPTTTTSTTTVPTTTTTTSTTTTITVPPTTTSTTTVPTTTTSTTTVPPTITTSTTTVPTTTTTSTTVPTTTTVTPLTVPPVNFVSNYYGVSTFNGNKVVSGYQNISSLLVKFDSNDNLQWFLTTTASQFSYFQAPVITSDENIYAAGTQIGAGVYDYGNGILVNGPSGNENAVIVKFDSSGNTQWGRTVLGTVNTHNYYGIGSNGNNEIYACGTIRGLSPFDFGNGVIISGGYPLGSAALMIAKYNATGFVQWARTETASASTANSIAADVAVNASDGTVYVVGLMYTVGADTHNFGNGVSLFTNGLSTSIPFILKYDSTGNAQWVFSGYQTSFSGGEHKFISVDTSLDGNVYAVGVLSDPPALFFGNGVSVTGGFAHEQILIVKFDSSGAAQWAKTISSGYYCLFNGVSVGSDGNIYAVGRMYGTGLFDFGDGVTISAGVNDYNEMIVAYSPNGTTLWVRTTLAGTSFSVGTGIAVTNPPKFYTAGYMGGINVGFNGTIVDAGTNVATQNRFLLKQD